MYIILALAVPVLLILLVSGRATQVIIPVKWLAKNSLLVVLGLLAVLLGLAVMIG